MSEFLDAMQEAADILTGKRDPARAWHPPAAVDVRAVRRRQKLTQEAFARRYGFTVEPCAIGSRDATSPTRPPAPTCW